MTSSRQKLSKNHVTEKALNAVKTPQFGVEFSSRHNTGEVFKDFLSKSSPPIATTLNSSRGGEKEAFNEQKGANQAKNRDPHSTNQMILYDENM